MSGRRVYFIQAGGEGGPIKIGSAGDPDHRLTELQTMNPHELTLLGSCVGGYEREFALHLELIEHCIRGEWFAPSPTVLAAMERCLDPDDDWDSVEAWDRRFDAAHAALPKPVVRRPADAVVDEVKPRTGLSTFGEICAAVGCHTAISWKQVWCLKHYKRVPEEERYDRQAAIYEARRSRKTESKTIHSTGESPEDDGDDQGNRRL